LKGETTNIGCYVHCFVNITVIEKEERGIKRGQVDISAHVGWGRLGTQVIVAVVPTVGCIFSQWPAVLRRHF
jgi:hypothetical protein